MIPGISPGRRLIMGDGPRTAKVVIVGEAPSAQDDREGKPFVGPSGQLLNDILHKVGIPRAACYVTNVVKEHPHANDIKPFLDLSKKYPVMSQEYKAYTDYLRQEIMDVHPNVVVAAGDVPLWALCGVKGIMNYRGSILTSTLIPGMKVIPCIHPADALRDYLLRWHIQFDMTRVRREMEFPWTNFKPREFILEPSLTQCMEYLDACFQQDLVAFDIEVYGTEVSCISFSYDPSHAISIPFIADGGDYFTPPQEAAIWRKIAQVLEDPGTHKVGQNTTFDATFLFNKYGIRVANIHDTMVAANIIYPDFPKGLAFITSVYSDLQYYKDDGKDTIHGRASANRQFWEYNAKDSIVLMEALPTQLTELERQHNLDTYNRQRALIPVLTYMTELGIRMDTDAMKAAHEEAEKQLAQLKGAFANLAPGVNPGSPKQLMDYFYVKQGIKPYHKRGTGAITVDEGALKRMARKGVKEAELLLQIRKLEKIDSTYFQMNLDADGRLRCSMNPGKTSSGRLASSKTIFGTGANMQNQPPIMKKFMLPDEGYVVYSMDLAQAENRIVAYIAPDLTMIDAFETGKDLHSLTASFITPAFGTPMTPDEIRIHHKLFEETRDPQYASPIGTGAYSWRYWGKKANHAFNYGQGYRAFAYQVEIPEAQGKIIHERYHSAYPGVGRMHEWIKSELSTGRTITNLFGRRRLYLDRWDEALFLEAYSFIPQSSIADKINEQGLLFLYRDKDRFSRVRILNQIHDSLVFEIPIDAGWEYHAEVILAVKESLETPLSFRGRTFTIPADITMHVHNMKDGEELKIRTNDIDTVAGQIISAYEKMQVDNVA